MPSNKRPAPGYDSKLDPAERPAYEAWARGMDRNPADEEHDYDLRGAFLDRLEQSDNGHLGDTYKKPNHPTFSDQSRYHGVDGNQGGHWDALEFPGEVTPYGTGGEVSRFTPGPTNEQHWTPEERAEYFRDRERGVLLNEGGKYPPMFADGGFIAHPETEVEQENGNVEPVPHGSLPEEVADDIDAKLSPGEVVIPADVVRWFGLKTFEEMRAEAKTALAGMHSEGRIQTAGGLMEPPAETGFEPAEGSPEEEAMESPAEEAAEEPQHFAEGGYVAPQGFVSAPYTDQFGRGVFSPTTSMPGVPNLPGATPTTQAPAPAATTPAPTATDPGAAPAPATTPAASDSGSSSWVAPAAVGATAATIAAATSGGSSDGGGLVDRLGNMATNYATKTATGGLGSLLQSGGSGEGVASTGSIGGDLSGIGDAIGQGASDIWNGAGNWIGNKYDAVSGFMDKIGSGDLSSLASNIDWASIGSNIAYTGYGIAAGLAGNAIGSAIHGPSDQQDVKTTVPVATAAGAAIGSIFGPAGTVVGTAIGAIVGQLASGEPDIPYTFSGGGVVKTDKGLAIAFTPGDQQNGGNPDTGTKMGQLVQGYVNLKAANDGFIVNPNAAGVGTGAIGYRAGQGYFYAAPGHAPGEDDYAWTGSNLKDLADVAYGDMIDRGILTRPGENVTNPGQTAVQRADAQWGADHPADQMTINGNGN
jgi:hypothetical protein